MLQRGRKEGQRAAVRIGHLIGGQVEGAQQGQRCMLRRRQAGNGIAVQQQGGGSGRRQAGGLQQPQRGGSLRQAGHAHVDERMLALCAHGQQQGHCSQALQAAELALRTTTIKTVGFWFYY